MRRRLAIVVTVLSLCAIPGSAGATTAIDVGMGDVHTCAVLSDGTVKCWGQNTSGELGNTSLQSTTTPVTVSGIGDASTVTLGAAHSCALLATHTVKCWGNNNFGQLGDGTTRRRVTPVLLSITNVIQLQAQDVSTCALKADNTVWCWGNTYGNSPVQIAGISTATSIAHSNGWHTCAVLLDASMRCWGMNNAGQLGNNSQTNAYPPSSPVTVQSVSNASTVTAGAYFTCALLTTQAAQCWGANGAGQLGNATTDASLTRVDVATSSDVQQLVAGESHACLITTGNVVKCWGQNNGYQLGDGTTTNRSSPTPISLPGTPSKLALGFTGTCAINSGSVDCWGTNAAGDNTQYATPYRVIGPPFTPTVSYQSLAGPGSARISYSSPNSHATSGAITCTSSDGGATQTATGTSSPVTVSGLTIGKTYSCTGTSSNDDGTSPVSSATSAFIAADTPSAPTITSVTSSGANTVSVSFSLGATNGASIDYTDITCSSPSGVTQSASGSSPVLVSNLSAGSSYTCAGASANAAGTGAASSPSTAIMVEGAPTAPDAPSVSVSVTNAIAVTVAPPSNNGRPISSYSATCSPTDSGVTRTATSDSPVIVVANLSPETSYSCTATATNELGTSSASAASQTLRALTRPAAPVLTSAAIASSGRVVVRFDAADTGGWTTLYAPICLSSNGGAQKTKIESSSPIVVADLTPRATYTCKVFASNAAGASDYSAESRPIYIRPVGITINDEGIYTNSPNVQLSIGWPAGAISMSISNDGGFNNARTFIVGDKASWTLVSSGPERLPKTVYVRFAGIGVDANQTYQDDIILDETPPTLNGATVSSLSTRASGAGVLVTTSAKDAISGVKSIQITSQRSRPAKTLAYAKRVRATVTGTTVWVRVADGAGNWSAWRKASASRRSR